MITPSNFKPPVLGVIYGNRDFFPDVLVSEARADIAKLFAEAAILEEALSNYLGWEVYHHCSPDLERH